MPKLLPTLACLLLFAACQPVKRTPIIVKPSENAQANALIHETSPYLLQHAYNPVNWRPWSNKAMQEAMKTGRPLLISIGYSSCHWCHVMEEKVFSDPDVAAFMNENFVCLKVDREERPDIDQIYMEACQRLTGEGGWPLNALALPDGRPFFASTYLKKEQWMQTLRKISKLYQEDREKLESIAEQLTEGIKESGLQGIDMPESGPKPLSRELFQRGLEGWKKSIDTEHGGYKGAPKFPMPADLQSLMVGYHYTQDLEILLHVKRTLNALENGGVYDWAGGGFSRYSVDQEWRVPHFEKMLYDNAQLVSTYAQAYQVTKKSRYRRTAYGTLDFMKRELRAKNGGFYASLSADSDGKEGKFYTWSQEELQEVLGQDHQVFKEFFHLKGISNWKGESNILTHHQDLKWLARELRISKKQALKRAEGWKKALLKARRKRVHPSLDNKQLTAWNALAVKAYAEAAIAFSDPKLLKEALQTARFIKTRLMSPNYRLSRQVVGNTAKGPGYLDDYALTAQAFLKLYEATLDPAWLEDAKGITEYAQMHFFESKSSYFYYTSDMDFNLIARKLELSDHGLPASNSIMALNLWKLGQIFEKPEYLSLSRKMLQGMTSRMLDAPSLHAQWWELYFYQAYPFYQVAIVGKDAEATAKSLSVNYLPQKILLGGEDAQSLSILKGKYKPGQTMIYVCKEGACKRPVIEVPEAMKQLGLR